MFKMEYDFINDQIAKGAIIRSKVCVHRLTKITSYKICFRSLHAEINGHR